MTVQAITVINVYFYNRPIYNLIENCDINTYEVLKVIRAVNTHISFILYNNIYIRYLHT